MKIKSGFSFLIYIYQYLYFRIYKNYMFMNKPFNKLNKGFNVELHVAHGSALIISVLIMVNYITLRWFVLNDVNLYIQTKPFGFILFFIIHFLNSFYFLYKKRYLNVVKRFEKETFVQKIISSLLVLVFIFLTFYFNFLR
jgi:hypothetical protein